jgi:hypothetical protein
MKIDPARSFAKVDEAIANASSPRHKAMLENYREHMAAEIDGDVDRIMATQIEEPQYHIYGQGVGDTGPKGQKEVRAFYQDIMDNDRNVLQYDIQKIFCSDDNLFHEGTLRIVFPGRALKEFGLPIDDPDAWYLYSYQTSAIFPYAEDGRAIGEDVYSDGPMNMDRIEKLEPDELPDILVERLKQRARS